MARCFRSTKGLLSDDCNRGLSRRQSDLREEGAGSSRAWMRSSRRSGVVVKADKIILPGVGHFAATAILDEAGCGLRSAKRSNGEFRSSASASECSGCSMPARRRRTCRAWPVRRESASASQLDVKSPHVGWNSLACKDELAVACRDSFGSFVYFTHSYPGPSVRRLWRSAEYGGAVLSRSRARQFLRGAISSGEIGSDRA